MSILDLTQLLDLEILEIYMYQVIQVVIGICSNVKYILILMYT